MKLNKVNNWFAEAGMENASILYQTTQYVGAQLWKYKDWPVCFNFNFA